MPRRRKVAATICASVFAVGATGAQGSQNPQAKPASAHRGHHRHHGRHGCAGTQLLPTRTDLPRIRRAVLCLINAERARHGERPLHANGRILRAAQHHSAQMARRGYFGHVSPSGATPLARVRATGYLRGATRSYAVGENIAWGTGSLATPQAIVHAWMSSPEHRANILNARYRDTAIGVSPHPPTNTQGGGRGATYTEDFAARTARGHA